MDAVGTYLMLCFTSFGVIGLIVGLMILYYAVRETEGKE